MKLEQLIQEHVSAQIKLYEFRQSLKESWFDKALSYIGKILDDKKTEEFKRKVKEKDPEFDKAIEEMNDAYKKLTKLMQDF